MDSINYLTQLVNSFLHTYMTFFFFSIFWNRKASRLLSVIVIAMTTVILSAGLILFKGTILSYIIVLGSTILVSCIFDSKIYSKVIYTVIVYALSSVLEVLTAITIQLIFSARFEESNSGVLFLIGMLLSKFITFVVILFVRLKKHNTLIDRFNKNYWGIFLFPFATLSVTILLYIIFTEVPHPSIFIQYIILFSFSLLIIANMIVFDFIDAIYKNSLYESKIAVADDIIISQTEQYQNMINHNNEIFRLRHDHKNFCIGLLSQLESGNVESAIATLSKEYDFCRKLDINQGSMIHALVDIKRNVAKKDSIIININHYSIEKIAISPTDLAIILGNAIDNAIDACKRIDCINMKEINISIIHKNDKIYIKVENPVKENVDTSNLISTKTKKNNEHGFGIISMRKIANKYNGEVLFACENKIFITTIILKNTSIY